MAITEWQETITRIYREALAEAGPTGADRQEVVIVASARIGTEIRAGRLDYSLESYIASELVRVDEADSKRADAVIRSAVTGQGTFDVIDLDVVVTLGAGRRKLWRDVTAEDLRIMDDVRHRNVRNVNASYAAWKSDIAALIPVVFEHGSFGAAFDAGGFPPKSAAESAVA